MLDDRSFCLVMSQCVYLILLAGAVAIIEMPPKIAVVLPNLIFSDWLWLPPFADLKCITPQGVVCRFNWKAGRDTSGFTGHFPLGQPSRGSPKLS